MKVLSFLLVAAALGSSPAFAVKKVQFTVDMGLDLCPEIDSKHCTQSGGDMPVHDSLVAVASEEDPGNVTVSKDYDLESIYGIKESVTLTVYFHKSFGGDGTEVNVELTPTDEADGVAVHDGGLLFDLKDLSNLQDILVNGQVIEHPMENGPTLAARPVAILKDIKVLE